MKKRTCLQRLGIFLLALALIGALCFGIAVIMARPVPQHPWFIARPGEHVPLVMAHQGGEGIRPNNTMVAFQHAHSLGADVLDMDVHISQDGVLVLMHDQTVDRTTDGTGAIRDLTLAELKQLDAGYSFSEDGNQSFPYRGQGITVPTLEEVFKAFPNTRFGIEIKQTPPAIARPLCALIRTHDLHDQVLISSFRQENMDAFRGECPEVATSATQDEATVFVALSKLGLSAGYSPHYHSLQVPEESNGIRILTPGFVADAHSRGLAVQPWTINEIADLQRLIDMGVDGINTNYPDRMLQLVK